MKQKKDEGSFQFSPPQPSPVQSQEKGKKNGEEDNQNSCAGDMMLAIGIDKINRKGGRLHDGVSFNAFIIGHDEGVDSFVLRDVGRDGWLAGEGRTGWGDFDVCVRVCR